MTVSSSSVTLSNPSAKVMLTKFVKVLRTDTTAAVRAALPKDAMITGLWVNGYVASDAATTAVIHVGSTSTATEYLASFDVKTAATGEGFSGAGAAAVGNAMGVRLASDLPVYVKYAETGTASTTGGPWYVRIDYFVPGPGELVDD